ncbi:MAG: hypothetical protein WHT07_08070 [Desulfobaccales bacterium]
MRAPKPLQTLLRPLPAAMALALLLLFAAAPARAITYTYTFDAITTNDKSGANASAGETQLRMDVTGIEGSTTVTFTFYLDGAVPMSITGIYFYDGVLGINGTSFTGFIYDGDVSFTTKKVNPSSLPGLDVEASVVFAAKSTPPVSDNGVNPNESLSIVFTLASGKDINSVVEALDGWLTDQTFNSGDLVVGLHVQAINNTGSESFVVGKLAAVSPVPLPGTALLLGSGLAALGLLARRRRKEPPAGP